MNQSLCMDKMISHHTAGGGVAENACLGCGHIHSGRTPCKECLDEYFDKYPDEKPKKNEVPISFTFYGTRWVVTFIVNEGEVRDLQ